MTNDDLLELLRLDIRNKGGMMKWCKLHGYNRQYIRRCQKKKVVSKTVAAILSYELRWVKISAKT